MRWHKLYNLFTFSYLRYIIPLQFAVIVNFHKRIAKKGGKEILGGSDGK